MELAAFARHRLRLARPQPDGSRLGDHLEALQRRTGRAHPLLHGPKLPDTGAHLWAWFLDLRAGQPAAMPLSHGEIAAWSRLSGVTVAAWELRALRVLDRVWIEEMFARPGGQPSRCASG